MAVTSPTQVGAGAPAAFFAGRRRLRENIEGWLFILPAVVGMLTFTLFPVIMSMWGSLTKWDAINPPVFIGLDNYVTMLTFDKFFRKVFGNTLYYTLGAVPLRTLAALGLALLVNRKMKGVTLYRTCYFAPVVTSAIAIGVVWSWVLAPEYGLLNNFLKIIGIKGPDWLADGSWAMPGVIIVEIWHGAGYAMVIFLAGLQGIPDVFYEAAKIDGAGAWSRFRHITVPLLSPTTFFILVTGFIGSFQVFGLIYIMTSGGPANATNVYIYYLYQNAFAYFKMGYACALAWVLFAVIGLVTFLQWRLGSMWVFYQ